jgi:S-adenosylmethionine:diacylglycerol 3-amino-3-carboxypropyl transferase
MALTQIFNSLAKFSGMLSPLAKNSPEIEQQGLVKLHETWPQIERRQATDRRLQERRHTHCQPYMDTRKSHGRRRSLGRRKTDQLGAVNI